VTRLLIIGSPVGPGPAEAVQRAALSAAGRQVEIERWERRAHQLSEALGGVVQPDVIGAMIGSPHKEKAASLIGLLSDEARASGAVNVAVNQDGRLHGFNTDVAGVRAGLESVLPEGDSRWPTQALVLGAGGGARAVVSVLLEAGLGRIAVFNRHLHRAEAVVAHFDRAARQTDLRALPWHETIIEAELAKARLVVNASGIGAETDESPIPAELIPDDLFVLDLVLNRAETPLMRDAAARGGTVANGQGSFLVAQAAAFTLWTGEEPPTDVMRTALADHLGLPEEGLAVVGD
jgi:shikimate dehydrogenase